MKSFVRTATYAAGIALGIAFFGIFARAMISHTPVSEWTGGKGRVVSAFAPVLAAKVSITDKAGTLSSETDADGRFDIPVESEKMFYLSMANPMGHEVAVQVEKDGVVLKRWVFMKNRLGWNYFDFGTIDIASDAGVPPEPKFIRR